MFPQTRAAASFDTHAIASTNTTVYDAGFRVDRHMPMAFLERRQRAAPRFSRLLHDSPRFRFFAITTPPRTMRTRSGMMRLCRSMASARAS